MSNQHSYSAKDITKLAAIEAIQVRPGMYIGSIDENGLHHLLQEVISNSIDEFLNGFGTRVDIMIDEKTNTATVVDDGRGIPFGKTKRGEEAMIEIATSLHAGGKFGEGGYSVSGGLHGIGLTAVNALSTHFKIVSNRDKQTATYTASRGETKSYNVSAGTGKVDGTLISFTPDTEIFGKHKFNLKRIEELVREMSYLTSGMKFYVNGKLFYSDNGLKDMIKDRSTDPITDLTYIVGEVDGFKVEIAFLFEPKSTERVFAFTNNIPNKEGGTHITGFRTAFTTTMNKLARQYNLIGENDANLSGDMMRRGMVLALSLKMNKAPVFQGQTKEKLMTAEARGAVSQVMGEFFEKSISKKDVKTIVDRALVEQRAEDAAKRSREAAKKMAAGGKDMKAIKDLPSKLADCKDRNGELWILEGKWNCPNTLYQ